MFNLIIGICIIACLLTMRAYFKGWDWKEV
jgi:hypothetical protein